MDKFFSYLRVGLTGTITLLFAFVFVYVPQIHRPPEAQALIAGAVVEVGPNLVANELQFVKDNVLDGIAFMLAKAVISEIMQSTITWINSGFKGSPAFVQDLDRFLLNAADRAAGVFLRNELGDFICEPFRIDIQLALAIEYQKSRENKKDSCTLSGIVENVEDFYNGSVGSDSFWDQWLEITSRPEVYTPYGQYMSAREELEQRIAEEEEEELYVLNLGSGFLSKEVCTEMETPTGPVDDCVYVTPGKTIADRVNKVFGADVDQLIAADEINEVISALLSQIATQALTGAAGLLGLSANTGYTSGNYGSGSIVDELVNQSYGQGAYAEQGVIQITDKYELQRRYNALAVEYIPRLQLVVNNVRITAAQRTRAEAALTDAVEVQTKTAVYIATLRPIVTELNQIATAYEQPNLTTEEKRTLNQRQAALISRGIQYQAYSEGRYLLSQQEWSDIVK